VADNGDNVELAGPPSVLRDPPAHAVRDGRLDPDLPICICGEQVAVAHEDCQALFNDSWHIRQAEQTGSNEAHHG
jgi:hypothetical protein